MKKYLIIFLILTILFPSALIAVQIIAADTDDDVVYTEHTIIGDPREADGIEVSLNLQMNDTLFWDVNLTLGEEIEEEADFTFDYDPPGYVSFPRPRFDLGFGFSSFGSSSSGDLLDGNYELFGMFDAVSDVASRAENGTEYTENVRIADYFEYYPIHLDIAIGDLHYDRYASASSYRDEKYGEMTDRIEAYFAENFRFRVPKNDFHTITVKKRTDGTVESVHMNHAEKSDYIYLDSRTVVTDDAIFFTCIPRSEENGIIVSESDTAYGLYRIPYQITEYETPRMYENHEYTDIRINETELVYPIAADCEVSVLMLSDDGDEIYLTSQKNRGEESDVTLTVLDSGNLSVIQETFLFTCGADHPFQLAELNEEFMVYKINWNTFAVIERSSGEWRTDFIVTDETISDYWSDQSYVNAGYDYGFDYDGKRLAVMGCSNERGINGSSSLENSLASFYIGIYSEKGNIYTGKFTSSLDTGTGLRYNYIVKPTDRYQPIIRLP